MTNFKKCLATGKVSFETLIEARIAMFLLKWGYKRHRDIYGKRIKHRQGKPAQKRVYYCPDCDGYHLTKWNQKNFKSYSEWQKKEIQDKNGTGFLLV